MKKLAILLVLLVLTVNTFAREYNPVASPDAVVTSGNTRFTVLLPRVIRMEYSAEGQFEDHASLVFINRNLPVPNFKKNIKDGWLTIQTDAIKLKYKIGTGEFTPDNLNLTFEYGDMSKSWQFGMVNNGNLLGTTRTLDVTNGEADGNKIHLDEGIISREGWVVIDDTGKPVFDNSDWPWVTARKDSKHQDLYFFAYGYNYKQAMNDFIHIAGRVALPPKYAFGYWFSKFRSFTELEFHELIGKFNNYEIPLDVLVTDMDWHITDLPEFYTEDGNRLSDQAGQRAGWTGFTWDKTHFSNPKRYLDWSKDNGLKICLNLHPASGVQPHEEQYEVMAKANGIDPATKKFVPFNITDKDFTNSYFKFLIHPLEDMGVDFWWLDWQQWGNTAIPGVNPTYYLNYVHYTDMERQNKNRPLIHHRWGGLGNHRYQLGFSGDTAISWSSLDYQPYFTSTAANVGFGYWGHDIGGHMDGQYADQQLFARWFQYGIFSPILKTHGGIDYKIKRRLWQYSNEIFEHLRDLVDMRYEMIPYIYTASRKCYDTGITLCRPMYYDYPKLSEAYEYRNEYMFGDDLLINPITRPMDPEKLFVNQKMWFPEGEWYEMFTGEMIDGNQILDRPFRMYEIPVYAKAGSVIPMQPKMKFVDQKPVDPLILSVVPGGNGQTKLYEDAGDDNDFKNGEFTFTPVTSNNDGSLIKIAIEPVQGKYQGMLKERAYEIRLLATYPPKSVEINGEQLEFTTDRSVAGFSYNGYELMTIIKTDSYDVNIPKTIKIKLSDADPKMLYGAKRKMDVLYDLSVFMADHRAIWKNKITYDDYPVINAAQTGLRIDYNPETAESELKDLNKNWDSFIKIITETEALGKTTEPYQQLLKVIAD